MSETAKEKYGGTKKKSKVADAQHRGQHRRRPPAPRRDRHHAEQVDHDEIGEAEVREHEPGDTRAEGDRAERLEIGGPVGRLRARPHRLGDGPFLVAADHIDIDVAAPAHESVHDGAEENPLPQGPGGLADDDLADVPGPGVAQDLLAHGGAREGRRLRAELLGETQRLHDPLAVGLRQLRVRRRLHVGDDPLGSQARGEAPAGADEQAGLGTGADAHEHALGHRPGLGDGVIAHVGLHLRVHAVGRPPQGQLPERDQVALAEEVLDRLLGLLREVDLAFLQALDQLVGGQVHQLDLVGPLEHRVRHRLAHDDAGDLRHEVVEALEVLDVERGVDVDAGVDELEHVLPPLGVARALGIAVGELVHQNDARPAGQGRVEIEFLERAAAVGNLPGREDLQSLEKGLRLHPAVGLDDAHDHVHPVGPELARGLEHGEGLADARRGAEEELEAAAGLPRLFLLRAGKEDLGVGPLSRSRASTSHPSRASVPEDPAEARVLEERILKGDAERVL